MQPFSLRNLVLVVLVAMALTACGGSSTPTSQPAGETQPTQTSLPPVPTETDAPTEVLPTTVAPTATSIEAPAVPSEVSFSADVLPVLKASCIRCHGTSRQSGDLVLNSYETLMAGAGGVSIVVPNEADASELVRVIVTGEMPKNDTPLSEVEIQIIRQWINQGALDN